MMNLNQKPEKMRKDGNRISFTVHEFPSKGWSGSGYHSKLKLEKTADISFTL